MNVTDAPLDDLPPGVFAAALTGEFKLNRTPHHLDDQGRAVFYFNLDKLDWTDVVESARLQLFGSVRDAALDARYAAVMAARADAAKAAMTKQKAKA